MCKSVLLVLQGLPGGFVGPCPLFEREYILAENLYLANTYALRLLKNIWFFKVYLS
jgi:hypothetical protein